MQLDVYSTKKDGVVSGSVRRSLAEGAEARTHLWKSFVEHAAPDPKKALISS
jgi:hypothetical protein